MEIQHRVKVEAAFGERLMAGDAAEFFANLPEEALQQPVDGIVRDMGSQRDPMPTIVGLQISWTSGKP